MKLWLPVLVCVLAACDGLPGEPDGGYDSDADLYPPDFWDPGDKPANPCNPADGGSDGCATAGVDCLLDPCAHGQCVPVAAGADWCDCEDGYAGELCDGCASGYVAEGLRCVPAEGCADSPCIYGTCRPRTGGGFDCDCQEGYSGRLCDACAEGYHAEDLRCVPDP